MPRAARLLLAGLLLAPLAPGHAQQAPTPQAPTPQAPTPQAPRNPAEARRADLDRAFEALRTAPDEQGAAIVEARIRALWAKAATPAVSLLIQRGMRNVQADLPAEALEDFDAAIVLAPDFPEAWFLRAQAYARGGDAAAAARDLQEVLRLEPRHWGALLSLAALQAERGEAQAALRSLRAALAINPKMPGGEERLRDLRRKAEGEAT